MNIQRVVMAAKRENLAHDGGASFKKNNASISIKGPNSITLC